ncbi:MAG: V-type ATPase 116kDa subunit family protein [Thermoleophilia bacterium]
MSRAAFVAPAARLRAMLLVIADAGVVQLVGPLPAPQGDAVEALRRLERHTTEAPAHGTGGPLLSAAPQPVSELERAGRRDILAGEVELERRAESAVRRSGFAVLVGWVPTAELPALTERLAAVGAAVVELRRPLLVEPPTLLRPARSMRPFAPLVATYGATRYADIDPTPFAAASFVLMFAMMFGDVGHGLALAALGLLVRRSRSPRLAGVRPLWPFAVAGGLAAAAFGVLYGEFLGPTGIVPALWLRPLDEPVQLLGAGLAVGALLLAVSYGIGILNRWREAGARAAVLAPSGIAGLAVFSGGALAGIGVYLDTAVPLVAGAAVALGGVALLFAGFVAEAGLSGTAVAESLVEVLDAVIRVGANLVSFTRLAAFGLMHAALSLVVLDAARSLWDGPAGIAAAVAIFALGTAAAFALEALVAGVQAMRLEYYELFSRVFAGEGEAFSPWRIPVVDPTGPA